MTQTAFIEKDAEALAAGSHENPFGFLGPHRLGADIVIRAFLPHAQRVWLCDGRTGDRVCEMERAHPGGLFIAAATQDISQNYRFCILEGRSYYTIADPFFFASRLGELDLHLLAKGQHQRIFELLGAHPVTHQSTTGVSFSVWAPDAARVSVVGDFNDWDGRRHPMRHHPGAGIWEIFIPAVAKGALYKFEIRSKTGHTLPLKADPFALFMEHPPRTASRVYGLSSYDWHDQKWMKSRGSRHDIHAPVSIYEVHPGSWRRDAQGEMLSYDALADQLIPYVTEMGFTHIELLPITEFPFDGSWGYQPIGLYAPTSRFGDPDGLRRFIDRAHQAGIGVLLDWVVGHFPEDQHGLATFDGTALYEHADPLMGRHPDWGTLIFDYGRLEVSNYLIGNALYWLEEFHFDGLRVDAVASMLYLDYSREPGNWTPNRHGGNENLDAVAFLQALNSAVYAAHPDIMMIAEESTSWPKVSHPANSGGLGFGYKWNMGWMNDTLRYMQRDPVHRKFHHSELTFAMMYAYSENFVLPLSHDEVVHGKGALLDKMPGPEAEKFANLRLYLSFFFSHPGRKLLFMGGEFAQPSEWRHQSALNWDVLKNEKHQGIQNLVQDLNRLYCAHPALHKNDSTQAGFAWIDPDDAQHSLLSFRRQDPDGGQDGGASVIIAANFTPVPRTDIRLGVPIAGAYDEIFNSNAKHFGGDNWGNSGRLEAAPLPCHGEAHSVLMVVPPLSVVMLKPTQVPHRS